jgi:carboxyl-terminal processing protease
MENTLEIVRTASRILVEESRIPVDAKKISEASEAGDRDAPTPWAAVRAMARAVNDPHTMLLSPAVGAQMQALIMGQSVPAPGFTLHRVTDGGFVVGEVVPGGPGAHAGLEPGDVVLSLDGSAVTRGFEDTIELMGKPEGTRTEVRVVRGGTLVDLQLTSTSWHLPFVESDLLDAGIGYLRLRFVTTSGDPDRDGAALVRRALEELRARGMESLVLDLRSNPGGYGVTRVASVLTDRDPIARYRDAQGNEEMAGRTDSTAACSCPMAVLVDDQTLSSAEMISFALQDHEVARVVGQPTAGGLTVPRYVPLKDGYVLMAVDRFAIGPRTGRAPKNLRVEPDVVVPNRTPEDYAARRDPQLERAVALLAK